MRRRDFIRRILAALSMTGCCGALLMGSPMVSPAAGFPKPSRKDRCPVCGMFVYKYPNWTAGFVFRSGAAYFHCCPKCMLHNLNNIPTYQPGRGRADLKLVWVTEYYTTKRMDAHDVVFVVGTNLVGPMGLDLIPVKGRAAAGNLQRDYNGGLILTLDQITPEVIAKARKGRLKR